jgi:acetyl esterase/lipase
MKKSFILFGLVLFLASCKKDEAPQETILKAETSMDLAYGNDPQQKMDVYLPAGRKTDSTKIIIMIHGGAWAEGDKADFNPYVPIMQQRFPEWAIFNINYRLATPVANAFPAQENDLKSVINFILQKKNDWHISDKIVLLGASAGAHMAMLQAYKNTTPKIKAVIDYFGPIDMVSLYNMTTVPGGQFGLQILLGGSPTSNPSSYQQSSPGNFIDAQDPPTIIFHGLADDVVDVSQSVTLQQKLQAAGIVNEFYTYPGMIHNIWPDAVMTQTFDKAEAFVKANVH